jgi:hypothetical protein
LYKNEVDVGGIEQSFTGEDHVPSYPWARYRMVKAYILADKLRDIDSSNLLMDTFDDTRAHMPLAVEVVSIVVNKTTTKSPLLKILVVSLCKCEVYARICEICESESIPKEFISDLFKRKRAEHPSIADIFGLDDEDHMQQLNEDENDAAKIGHEKYLEAKKTWDDSEEYKEAIQQIKQTGENRNSYSYGTL